MPLPPPGRSRAGARPGWLPGRRLPTGLLVTAGLGIAYLATIARGALGTVNHDSSAAALAAWRLGRHGDLWLDAYAGWSPWLVPAGEHVVSNRFPGVIGWYAPFYALLGRDAEPTLLPAAVGAAVATTLAMAVLYRVLRDLTRPAVAAFATVLAGLGSATWTVSADQPWGHGPAQLWLLLALRGLQRGHPAWAGLALGLAVLTRPHLALAAAVLGVAAAWALRSLRPAVAVAAGSGAGLLALGAYNVAVFGSVSLRGGYDAAILDGVGQSGFLVNVAGTLASPQRGVLFVMPFVALLLPGLGRAWRGAGWLVRSAAVAGLAYAVVQLALNRFSGGVGFYGNRLMLEPLTLAAPLLVASYLAWVHPHPARRAAFAALATLTVAGHAVPAVSNLPSYVANPWGPAQLTIDLPHHGPLVTLGWVAATTAAVIAAARLARRHGPGAVPPSGPPSSSDRSREPMAGHRQEDSTQARPAAPSADAPAGSASSAETRSATAAVSSPATT